MREEQEEVMSLQTNEYNSPMTMNDYRSFVEDLAVTHRTKHALRCLMTAGSLATAALREGLRHPEPAVRIGCCMVLDHHMDPAAVPELIENLHHENEIVRAWAMHALACDRCKYARDHDPHPVVRKIAGWYTPGGPIYKRLAPIR